MARKPSSGLAGDPELLILSSLAAGPEHGYAIMLDVADFAETKLGPGYALFGHYASGRAGLDRAAVGSRMPAPVSDHARGFLTLDSIIDPAASGDRRGFIEEAAHRMKGRIVTLMVHLYPASWRAEYGQELAAILSAARFPLRS